LSYPYKYIELALAENFGVTPEDMPAFRARLRHLRNLGVPAIPAPGSGQKIDYKRAHAIQLLVALELELLGMSPQHAASFSRQAMKTSIPAAEEASRKNLRQIMSVEPSFELEKRAGWVLFGNHGRDPDPVARDCRRAAYVDIAGSISMLDASLKRLNKGK
jgi:hypothetical protein